MKFIRNSAALVILVFILDILRYFVFPDVSALESLNPERTAFMEYRQKAWKSAGWPDRQVSHKWVPLRKISGNLQKAVLIAEDDKFWQHEGFDYEAMERALEKNLKERKVVMGGSTISQQLAKNLWLSPSKNPVRKIKEAILTWRIERTLTKRRILEIYLNVAEWGDGIFGIEAAARHYYGISAGQLSAVQSSRLAAVLPNPIRWSPTGNTRYVRNRSAIIYKVMVRRGVVVPRYREITGEEPVVEPFDTLNRGVPQFLIDQALWPER